MTNHSTYWRRAALVLAAAWLLAGCHLSKYVPANEYLLSRVNISIDEKSIDRTELKTYLKQKPNTKIFGFWKFHLSLYNLSYATKENDWLKRIGEAPVIYDPYLTARTREEFGRFLQNKGYYQASIRDSTILRKNGKAEVNYYIRVNRPYVIRTYRKEILDDSLKHLLEPEDRESLVRQNGLFDSDNLGNESTRLLKKLQNDGYYKSTRNIFSYEADTTGLDHGVSLKLVVDQETYADSANQILKRNHEKYTLRNFYYLNEKEASSAPFSATGNPDDAMTDTIRRGNHFFIYKGRNRLKPEMLINLNHLADKGFFSTDMLDRTYNEYFASRLFKLINIHFVEIPGKDPAGNPVLDCYIQLTPSMSQSYSASIEGTNSLGNYGVAGNLGYQHKNLFRGGEILDVQFLAGTQKHTYGNSDSTVVFNSLETGVDAKITVPKFMAPFFKANFSRYSTPQTFFNISYNYQRTPDYTRTIARSAFGYQWKSSNFTTHKINLLDINLVKMFALDPGFLSSIENLYIRSSYEDHSISSFNYTYAFSTQTQKKADYKVVRATVETAGNVLYGVSHLLNRTRIASGDGKLYQYYFLNTPFAQYIKFDLEYRKGWMHGKNNAFAVRAYGGAAFAYGNSEQIPFERKFFSGGANGLRAWSIRTLGPGTYQSRPTEFPNQSGDIKLEANSEYRFRLIGSFEGAFFLDMGNIWSVRDNRPGTEFKLNGFYKDIAVGSGLGLRYDFTYVIMRLDLGIKIHDPAQVAGQRWISPGDYFRRGNTNFVFAVGYPF